MGNTTGTTGSDTLVGGAGADVLSGGEGSDLLNGGSGNDILDGGSGNDTVMGGSGSDILIFRAYENHWGTTVFSGAGYDSYNGGTGAVQKGSSTPELDRLNIYLSADQLANDAFMTAFNADIAAYQAFITANTNRNTDQTGQAEYTFTTINLKASAIEQVSVIAASQVTTILETDAVQSRCGTLVQGNTALTSFAGYSCTDSFGKFTVSNTGAWTFTMGSAKNELAVGECEAKTYNITAADGSIVSVKIVITGTNDAPTVAGALTSSTNEGDASYTLNLLQGASDVDHNETASLKVSDVNYKVDAGIASSTAPAGVSLSGNSLTVDPTNAAFNSLAMGETMKIVVSYNVEDAQGAKVPQTETITVTGTNDIPTVAGALTAGADEGAAVLSLNLLQGASDVDHGETATLSVTDVKYAVDGGSASDTPPAGLSLTDGTLSVDPTNAAFDHLSVGKTTTIVVTYKVTDIHGASVNQTETITITGTNDGPVANSDTGSTTENTAVTVNVLANDTDVDDGAVLTVTAASAPSGKGSASVVGNEVQFDPGTDFDHLAEGATEKVTVSYSIEDEHGATSNSTVEITVTGTNDAPVANADTNSGDAVTESGVNPGDTEFAGDASASGNVIANDTDADDDAVLTVAAVGGEADQVGESVEGTYGSVTINENGSWSYSLNNGDDQTQALKQGQSVTETFAYTVTDEHGATSTANLVITITGTNDAPVAHGDVNALDTVVEAGVNDDGSENAGDPTAAGNVLANDTDVDTGHKLTVAAVAGATAEVGESVDGTYGSVIINKDGSWAYTLDNDDDQTQALKQGETVIETFEYTVTDEFGATSTANLVITITGTNDAPVANADTASATEDLSTSGSVASNDSDVDRDAKLTYTLDGDAPTGLTFNEDGSWSFDASSYDSLAKDEVAKIEIPYTVTDEHGASAGSTLTITIIGTNDKPTVSASDSGPHAETESGVSVNGTISFTDLDLTDRPVVTTSFKSASYKAADGATVLTLTEGQKAALGVALTVTPDAGNANDGSAQWSYSVGDAAVDFLAKDETVVLTYEAKVDDKQGGTATQTFTITLTGTNDAPVAQADTASVKEDASITGSVATNDSDVDHGATLTYALNGPAPTGLTFGTNGSWTFDASSYDSLAKDEPLELTIPYTVTDQHGASASSTLKITVTGTNDGPVAVADTASVAEDANTSGSVATNDSDVDHGAVLTYALDGAAPTGLTFGTNGSWTFDASSYDSLAKDEVATLEIPYTVTDEHGAQAGATLTITITGTNDTPTISAANSGPNAETESGVSATGTISFTDVDLTDKPTVSASFKSASYTGADGSTVLTLTDAQKAALGVALTVTPDAANGHDGSAQWSYSVGDAAVDFLVKGETVVLTYEAKVDDGNGGVKTQDFTITLTGTNDAPTVAAALTSTKAEGDASYALDLLTGASDVDHGETATLSVADVSYSVNGGPSSTTPPAGLSLFGSSLTVDPANAAFNSLAVGESTTILVSYNVKDAQGATVPQTQTVKITGTNDNPDIRAEAGDSTSATLPETNAGLSATGKLTVTDADTSDTVSTTVALTTVSGNQGLLTNDQLKAMLSVAPTSGLAANSGATNNLTWTFNSGSEAFNFLSASQSLTLTYTLTVDDGHGGSDTQNVTVTVNGSNDAAVITGASTGSITEDAVPNTVSGNLNSTDVDGTNDAWTPVTTATASANGYGTFTVDAAGVWTYTLNNGNPTVNALNNGGTLPDSFTVTTADGTTKVVNITINGHSEYVYSQPSISTAPDVNDFDGLRSTNVRSGLLIMGPNDGPNGADLIDGSNAADTIYGGNGDDSIYGHDGGDFIYGENAADMKLYGQAGDDHIYGGSGGDSIWGGSGNDEIFGNSNPDSGGDSGDTIYGGSGRDTINGQGGNDVIYGGNGQDLLTGGDGADTFAYTKATDTGDFIFDFTKGSDRIDLSALGLKANGFIGALAGPGEVDANQFGYRVYNNGTTTVTTIYVDTDGVYGSDMEITLVSNTPLNVADFILAP